MTAVIEQDAEAKIPASRTLRALRPREARFAFLLIGSFIVFSWNLGVNGWGNDFYAAAVQAGTSSWKAFIFGSSDMGNLITVDKPPASLWVMELAARVFGFHPLTLLLPEVLMGVATVALLYQTILPRAGETAALISGALLVTTPVAVLMFRFDNPDALLVLLLTASVAATLKAIDTGNTWWLLLAGAAVGTGFLTKQLQAFLVLPALVCAYLVFANVSVLRRILDLLAALVTLVFVAGWWVAIVQLTPPSDRPFIGGSQSNNFLELTFGYNGFGRLTGTEVGSVTSGNAGVAPSWGATGFLRLFDADSAGQITWLIWPMVGLLIAAFVVIGRAPRRETRRLLLVVFGIWFAVTFVVFSYMAGIFHAYYTVALAPPLAGLMGVSVSVLFRARHTPWVRLVLVTSLIDAALWAFVIVYLTDSSWTDWVQYAIPPIAAAAATLIWIASSRSAGRVINALAVGFSLAVISVGPMAFDAQTVATPRIGAEPEAGPTYSRPSAGLLAGPKVEPRLARYLRAGGASNTWAAAVVGSEYAAAFQLAIDRAVMPLGGFNGSDPSPTLTQFKFDVAHGAVRFYIAVPAAVANGGSDSARSIDAWVKRQNYPSERFGDVTVYDLSS